MRANTFARKVAEALDKIPPIHTTVLIYNKEADHYSDVLDVKVEEDGTLVIVTKP